MDVINIIIISFTVVYFAAVWLTTRWFRKKFTNSRPGQISEDYRKLAFVCGCFCFFTIPLYWHLERQARKNKRRLKNNPYDCTGCDGLPCNLGMPYCPNRKNRKINGK